MIKIAEFLSQHIHTIGIVYLIVAAVVFAAVIAFFVWIARAEDEERELYTEDEYYYPDEPMNGAETALFVFLMAAGCAILWFFIPVVLVGVWFYTKITEKFPELMGHMADDDNEETEEDK